MINRHDFQQAAKSFRAGRLSLQQFTTRVFEEGKRGEKSTASSVAPPQKDPPPSTDPAVDTASDLRRSGPTASLTDTKVPMKLELPTLPTRPTQAHKGDFGRVLMIGGSVGMAGAISLASLAALRSGSGLVKAAVPREVQPTVAAYSPCYMTIGCLSDNGEFHGGCLDSLEAAARWSDVIGLGPGMERGAAQKWIVPRLYRDTHQPMIVDADGLNTLADAETDLSDHVDQRILTPHPGEFQRLLGTQTADRATLESRAIELAATANLVIVLKGNRTLVTDGQQTYHNTTGNPGMATAGAGDVLTGMISSLVGQGLPLFNAAQLGVYLHGLAGDFAADRVGQVSLNATDLLESIPHVFLKFQNMATQNA